MYKRQNVNLSSLYKKVGVKDQKDGTQQAILEFTGFIDGNTGIHQINYEQFQKDIVRVFNGEIVPEELKWDIQPTDNTRLYDTYWEIKRNAAGQVVADVGGSEVVLPISTERVEHPNHLIISAKE